jgi:putative transposase
LQEVIGIRKQLPKVGTRKLHYMLEQRLQSHNISIGRDALFNLLSDHGMLIRQRKRKAITTNSNHWMKTYVNLVRDIRITRPEQVWVSDITYIRMVNRWGYLCLITDAYSKRIMGYSFRTDMTAKGCIDALLMALDNRVYNKPIIHHSDRGSQYCSKQYVDILIENYAAISMTEHSDPYENAIAERVNGIIKSEFELHTSFASFETTYKKIKESISNYNSIRPHASCDYLTPNQAHVSNIIQLKKRWKNYSKNYYQNLNV